MRLHKGYLLGFLGLGVLALSLVLSGPFTVSSGLPDPPSASGLKARGAAAVPDPADPIAATPFYHEVPIQESGVFRFQSGQYEAFLAILVPSGRRMVIEQLTFRAGLEGEEDRAVGSVATLSNGGSATHLVPMTYQGAYPDEGRVYVGTESLQAYADGGTTLQLKLERTGLSEHDSGWFSLSGVLVPMN